MIYTPHSQCCTNLAMLAHRRLGISLRSLLSRRRRGPWLRPAWAAAILERLDSAPERPGDHLVPAFKLLVELCKPQHPIDQRPSAPTPPPAGAGTEADSPLERAAAEAVPSEPVPASHGNAGAAEGMDVMAALEMDGVRLVVRLLLQRLLEGSTADQQAGAADLQVRYCSGRQQTDVHVANSGGRAPAR